MSVTFSDFCVHFKFIRGEDVVDPPCESPLQLLNPPLIIEHVLCSERHRVSRYGWKKRADGQNFKYKFQDKQNALSDATEVGLTITCHQLPVCTGLTKVSFDCATATIFAAFTDEAPDDLRDWAPVNNG